MGPGLRLTAMSSPGLPFNGRHPHDPCKYIDHYSFTDPGGMEGRVCLVVNLEFVSNTFTSTHPGCPGRSCSKCKTVSIFV